MTPAEQGQEADERRWTIYKSDDERFPEDCRVDGPPTTDHPEEEVEVVPASELEMCQRYFPFMRRSRDEAVRKLSACQEERDAAGVEADEQRRERQAAETARDEAVNREKALREALTPHLLQAADEGGTDTTELRAALDQSGKP